MEPISGSVCRACRIRMSKPLQRHAFSTTAKVTAIPPESPHYVDVPQSHQAEYYPPRRVKGILPVPRELFPKKYPEKSTEQYILNTTPDRRKPIDATKLDQHGKYKMQMGLMRKQHFREGFTELYKRKQNTERVITLRSDVRKAERERLVTQPDREDARLTNVSVPKAMQPKKMAALSTAEAMEMYETKKANLERHAAAKLAARQDALHTLYMNARDFIMTEEQLAQRLTMEFDEKEFAGGSGNYHAKSEWEGGAPDTIKGMIDRTFLSPRTEFQDRHKEEAYNKDQSRMKRIAEKLSGGKI